ncbi:MAG TPA: TlpA family protein disulfide reductase [Thiomicrorhabdus sp.]|nr:TlpA family protein disulfide reductase [Thiomicrorhabdus sp.]
MLIIKFIRYIGLLGLLSLSFLQGGCERTGFSEGVSIGKPFPELRLVTYDNEPFELHQLRGKVVILRLWATWCGVCREEAPKFLVFSKKLDDSVVVVSVSVDENLNAPKEYLLEYPDEFLHLFDQSMVQSKLVLKANVIPQVYVIDQEGVLRYYSVGTNDWGEDMLKRVKGLSFGG